MYWANFLHIYQPVGQQPDILEAVVSQSYRPLIRGALEHEGAKFTLNISGSLLELFDRYGYHDLIRDLVKAAELGRIEFTGSAKYHALLPFLNRNEILRQIQINTETNRHYLGDVYQPKGVFLPEMAYDPKLAPILEEAGFEWMLIDEIAFNGQVEAVDYSKLYRVAGTDLKVFFRERRTSNLIMSAVVRDSDKLIEVLGPELDRNRYLITGMDGETFGHHRPGLENLLFEIFDSPKLNLVTISELPQHFPETVDISPVASTWASSPEDIAQGIQFISWNDPTNPIHKLQWELRDFVLEEFYKLPPSAPEYPALRAKLDGALASDQFFWASAKPWWSIEMIEDGAVKLLEILRELPTIEPARFERGENLYHQIVATAFDFKRSGKLLSIERQREGILRIPFKERTLEAGGAEAGVYRAFIELMQREEKRSAERGDYEAAILWRDAVYKIEHKTDMYEAIHAVDLLRTKLPSDEIEALIARYKEQYLRIRGGQPEQRDA